jgi:hypothetical protein
MSSKYRTYRVEKSSPGFWVVTDPNKQTASGGEKCMGVFETRDAAKGFVDEMMAAAGRAIAQAMRARSAVQ